MANTAKIAILRAKVNGIATDLMVKTIAEHVYVGDVTLAEYLKGVATSDNLAAMQEAIDALGALANKDEVSQADLDDALAALIAGKAEQSEVDELSGKVDTLIGEDTGKSARTIANEELAKQLVPEGAAESLDTLTEIAAWIQSHPDDAAAMNAAIAALQNKLSGIDDGTGTVKKYIDDAITALKIGDYAKAADLTELAARVTGLEGKSHEHANKEVLDGISAEKVSGWDDAESKAHEHSNKEVLDGITAAQVASWDGKAKVYAADATVDLAEGELYIQLVE